MTTTTTTTTTPTTTTTATDTLDLRLGLGNSYDNNNGDNDHGNGPPEGGTTNKGNSGWQGGSEVTATTVASSQPEPGGREGDVGSRKEVQP